MFSKAVNLPTVSSFYLHNSSSVSCYFFEPIPNHLVLLSSAQNRIAGTLKIFFFCDEVTIINNANKASDRVLWITSTIYNISAH